jgi:hypothetical protein
MLFRWPSVMLFHWRAMQVTVSPRYAELKALFTLSVFDYDLSGGSLLRGAHTFSRLSRGPCQQQPGRTLCDSGLDCTCASEPERDVFFKLFQACIHNTVPVMQERQERGLNIWNLAETATEVGFTGFNSPVLTLTQLR